MNEQFLEVRFLDSFLTKDGLAYAYAIIGGTSGAEEQYVADRIANGNPPKQVDDKTSPYHGKFIATDSSKQTGDDVFFKRGLNKETNKYYWNLDNAEEVKRERSKYADIQKMPEFMQQAVALELSNKIIADSTAAADAAYAQAVALRTAKRRAMMNSANTVSSADAVANFSLGEEA